MDIFNRINVYTDYKDVTLSSEQSKLKEPNTDETNDTNATNDTNDTNDTHETNDTNDTNKTNEIGASTSVDIIKDVDSDSTTSIIYDILHIFDNIYSYGRTFIENNYFNLSVNDDFNLVYPNIYIGNYSTSTNSKLLKNLGITHIISVIPSFNPPFADKFKYLHIEAYDDEMQDIKQYFDISNEFIHNCLNEGGKILIHCMVGRSRSVTLFLSFLIYIIQGNFNKNSLNLDGNNDNDNDIYSSIEYNKFIKINKDNNSSNNNSTNNYTFEKISTVDHIKPQLNNKEKNFIIYKKETMLHDVEDLISAYTILKKEITIKKKSVDSGSDTTFDFTNSANTINDLNTIIKNMKKQSGNHFIIQILKYIKKYRPEANPNPYFLNQLSDIIF
jgi:hypothetical protein